MLNNTFNQRLAVFESFLDERGGTSTALLRIKIQRELIKAKKLLAAARPVDNPGMRNKIVKGRISKLERDLSRLKG